MLETNLAKRVVITGMGAITPIGNNIDDYWKSLKSGVSGSDAITLFDYQVNLKPILLVKLKISILWIILIERMLEKQIDLLNFLW